MAENIPLVSALLNDGPPLTIVRVRREDPFMPEHIYRKIHLDPDRDSALLGPPEPNWKEQVTIHVGRRMGVSYIRGYGTYGVHDGKWEAAVLRFRRGKKALEGGGYFRLADWTPVTNDVEGWLTEDMCVHMAHQVAAVHPWAPRMVLGRLKVMHAARSFRLTRPGRTSVRGRA